MAAVAGVLGIVSAIEALVPVGITIGHAIGLLINKDGSVTPVIILNNAKGDAMQDMADITAWYVKKHLQPPGQPLPNAQAGVQDPPVPISSILAGG